MEPVLTGFALGLLLGAAKVMTNGGASTAATKWPVTQQVDHLVRTKADRANQLGEGTNEFIEDTSQLSGQMPTGQESTGH